MRNKIKELTEVVKELNKLFDQLIKLAWKVSALAGVIQIGRASCRERVCAVV